MAKIFKPGTEEIIKETVAVLEAIECDICGKRINTSDEDSRRYFRVMSGHSDWGNDSCDSIEYRDVCPECLLKLVKEYMLCDDHVWHSTNYINIDTEYVYEIKERIE